MTTTTVSNSFNWMYALIILLSVAVTDYMTGYELGFFAFYFLPIAFAAWRLGLFSGFSNSHLFGNGLVLDGCIDRACVSEQYRCRLEHHHPIDFIYHYRLGLGLDSRCIIEGAQYNSRITPGSR